MTTAVASVVGSSSSETKDGACRGAEIEERKRLVVGENFSHRPQRSADAAEAERVTRCSSPDSFTRRSLMLVAVPKGWDEARTTVTITLRSRAISNADEPRAQEQPIKIGAGGGVEPSADPKVTDFESRASASFTTPARPGEPLKYTASPPDRSRKHRPP